MNREEILAKSREENKNKQDEMEQSIGKDGALVGAVTTLILSTVFMIAQVFAGKGINYGFYAFPFAFLGTCFWVKWKKVREKKDLILALIHSFQTAVLSFAFFFLLFTE